MADHLDTNDTAAKPITGRHVLFAMLAFFGVIIAVNFTMATLAGLSWTGLEVKNSYVASQDYNDKLQTADRQKALGWKSSLSLTDGELRLVLLNSAGTGIAGARIEGNFKRPVQERDDYPVAFTEIGAGQYRAVPPETPGLWDVDLTVHVPASTPYRQIFRIRMKD